MKITKSIFTLLATVAVVFVGAMPVHADGISGQGTWESTLLGRDINLNAVAATSNAAVYLYDITLNVTWLRDANANGPMDWATANNWATNLVTGTGSTAINGWRLPTMAANPDPTLSYDGSTANGTNVSPGSSEMASLFYITLGNKAAIDTNSNPQAGWSFGSGNTGSFQNMQYDTYWLGTPNATSPTNAWVFITSTGTQDPLYLKEGSQFAMALHSGDVLAPVPEPETYAMLLAGLGLIGAVVRRRYSGKTLLAPS